MNRQFSPLLCSAAAITLAAALGTVLPEVWWFALLGLAVLLSPTALLWCHDPQHIPGTCRIRAYDLRTLPPTSPCPECGAPAR